MIDSIDEKNLISKAEPLYPTTNNKHGTNFNSDHKNKKENTCNEEKFEEIFQKELKKLT